MAMLLFINNIPIAVILDSGAEVTIMSLNCAKRLKLE